jgi:hypothetical protein
MWIPRSYMLYSPLDSPESSLSDLFTVPENVKQQSQKKMIDLELANARFVRPSRAFLAASSAEDNDQTIRMSSDSDCISCRTSTIKATARITHQTTPIT